MVAIDVPVWVYVRAGRADCSASVMRLGVNARSSGDNGSDCIESCVEDEEE